MITFSGDRVEIKFDSFDLNSYKTFLQAKTIPEHQVIFHDQTETYTVTAPARFSAVFGIKPPIICGEHLPLSGFLFDYQKALVARALNVKRFALWEDCGLGKTVQFIEWSKHVVQRTGGGKVLIISPLQIIPQTLAEHVRFYPDEPAIRHLHTRDEMIEWIKNGSEKIAITNQQKFIAGIVNEMRLLAGVVIDESSWLKSGGGVIKWHVIKSCRGVEYKLSCTATPAPNDIMEYASQAGFLEKLKTENDILWTYFQRNKTGVWAVKPHAKEAFFRFMADWSIYLRNPAHYGWVDNMRSVPEPQIHVHKIQPTAEQNKMAQAISIKKGSGMLMLEKLGVVQRTKLNQIAKGFIYEKNKSATPVHSLKPEFICRLMEKDILAGRQCLVWTIFDEESEIIRETLKKLGLDSKFTTDYLHGSNSEEEREISIERFRNGQCDALVSKAQLLGFGLNFQFCQSMIFSGWNDSYEAWYQAVRRAYRYGQTQPLQVHIPIIQEIEGMIYDNILRKKEQFETATNLQESQYVNAMKTTFAENSTN